MKQAHALRLQKCKGVQASRNPVFKPFLGDTLWNFKILLYWYDYQPGVCINRLQCTASSRAITLQLIKPKVKHYSLFFYYYFKKVCIAHIDLISFINGKTFPYHIASAKQFFVFFFFNWQEKCNTFLHSVTSNEIHFITFNFVRHCLKGSMWTDHHKLQFVR